MKFIQEKLVDLTVSAKTMRDQILSNQNEINTLNGIMEEQTKVVTNNAKALAAMQIARYIVLALHIFIWLPSTIEFIAGGNTSAAIANIILMFVIWKFIMGKFVVKFIQKIVGKIKGKANDQVLEQAAMQINNVQQSISEKTNAIAYIQTQVDAIDEQMEKLKKNREQVADKLSLIPQKNMAEKFNQLVG